VIALPGVPREMEYLLQNAVLPYLRKRYQLTSIIKARVLHTAGVGESQIDDLIGDLETLNNPTVGLAAHSGQVDVRLTAKAATEAEADELIRDLEEVVRDRLGNWIYGVDQETLEEIALKAVKKQGWTLAVVEAGIGGELLQRLATKAQAVDSSAVDPTGLASTFRGGEVLTNVPTPEELAEFVLQYRLTRQVEVCLGVAVYPGTEKRDVHIVLITPEGQQQSIRPYGGPPEYAPRWALHHGMDLLRKL
jgi:hypothetical protein